MTRGVDGTEAAMAAAASGSDNALRGVLMGVDSGAAAGTLTAGSGAVTGRCWANESSMWRMGCEEAMSQKPQLCTCGRAYNRRYIRDYIHTDRSAAEDEARVITGNSGMSKAPPTLTWGTSKGLSFLMCCRILADMTASASGSATQVSMDWGGARGQS